MACNWLMLNGGRRVVDEKKVMREEQRSEFDSRSPRKVLFKLDIHV